MSKKTFVLHDESVNTQGFRLLTSGCDLTEFRKNPVMLLNHDSWSTPIGRWENIRIENNCILADADFDMDDENAARIAGKVERGYMRAASIGAWPPEEVSTDPLVMLAGQTHPTVTKWTAREASVCTIGSNHNALAFWDKDNNRIDLNDHKQLVRLFDIKNVSPQNNSNMTILTGLLNLNDQASEQALVDAVRKIIELRDKLQTENAGLKTANKALQDQVTAFESAKKNEQTAEAVKLVDAAIKDGRLDAKGKAAWLQMFDNSYDQAKAQLEAIPARQPVSAQVQPGAQAGAVKLADMSFADILKADRLRELKAAPELYKEKFFAQYGRYPA